MIISLPSNTVLPALAAKEWLQRLRGGTIAEIDRWARSMEATWGPCRIFLEVPLPVPESLRGRIRRSQVDLLVAFGDRAALCEIKSHQPRGASERDFDAWYEQISVQLDLLRILLKTRDWPSDAVMPFLFLPGFDEPRLGALEQRLVDVHSAHHVRVMGANPALRGRKSSSGRPLYVSEALAARLGRIPAAKARQPVGSLADAIADIIQGKGTVLGNFNGLGPMLEHLQAFYSQPKRFVSAPWHIQSLRASVVGRAVRTLQELGLLELVGPPGIGKTSVAKDAIEKWLGDHSLYDARELSIGRCRNANDVVWALADQVVQRRGATLDVSQTIEELVVEQQVFWIVDYDASSRGAIEQFLKVLVQVYARHTEVPPARWIVETHAAFSAMAHFSLPLPALAPPDLARILTNLVPGHAHRDPEEVISRARGNPRMAITLWSSDSSPRLEVLSEVQFQWIFEQLPSSEAKVLPYICLIASMSPIGLPMEFVVSWVQSVCGALLPDEAGDACRSTIARLVATQLARVDSLDPATIEGLFENAQTGPFEVLVSIDLGLSEAVLSSKRGGDSARLTEHIYDRLDKLGRVGCDVLAVTLALQLDDLGPFFRSSFRHSAVRPLLLWIDRTGLAERLIPGTLQFALLRGLQLIDRLRAGTSISPEDITAALGEQKDDTPEIHYVRQVLQGHGVATSRDTNSDLNKWIQESEREQDLALRAEMRVRFALAHATVGKAEIAWSTLREMADGTGLGPAVESLVLGHALAQLNRHKITLKGLEDPDIRSALIERYANRLFRLAHDMGNVALASDALFYRVRDVEFRLGREKYDSLTYERLLTGLNALEFVERTSSARRIQAILTEGSIHRHCGRWEQVGWDEFSEHMEAAGALYSRAFGSALPRRQFTFAVNSASYMVDFCMKALRFSSRRETHAAILTQCRKTIELAEALSQTLAAGTVVGNDAKMAEATVRAIPILEFIVLSGERVTDTSILNGVVASIHHLVANAVERAEIAADAISRRAVNEELSLVVQQTGETIRHCQRGWDFCRSCATPAKSLESSVRRELKALVSGTAKFAKSAKDGRLFQDWKRLSSAL